MTKCKKETGICKNCKHQIEVFMHNFFDGKPMWIHSEGPPKETMNHCICGCTNPVPLGK